MKTRNRVCIWLHSKSWRISSDLC